MEENFLAALFLPLIVNIVVNDHSSVRPFCKFLHFVQSNLPLQDVLNNLVTSNVDVISLPGAHTVPRSKIQFLRQPVNLFIWHTPLIWQVTFICEENSWYLKWYSYKELALAGSLKISQYKASRDHFYYPLNIHYCKINFEGE